MRSSLRGIKWHSLSCKSDIKTPSILTPQVTLCVAAAALDYSFQTWALKQAQCLQEKVSEVSSNGWGGRLGPRGFDWSAPSNTQGKKNAKKKKCFVRRARGIPWAVSLNKPGVKHPPAPPTLPHTLHFSSHSLLLCTYYPPLPSSFSHSFSPQSDRGIIVPQGFRWCDISVTWRRAVSCSP